MLRKLLVIAALVVVSIQTVSFSDTKKWVSQADIQSLWIGDEWKDTIQDSLSYYPNGLVNDSVDFLWNSTANQYVKNTRTSWVYDTVLNVTQLTVCTWAKDAGDWDTASSIKWSYVYDAKKKPTEITMTTWSKADASKRWYNASIVNYTYNQNSKIVTEIDQVWDKSNGVWKKTHKWVHEYDASGRNNIVKIHDTFSTKSNDWVKYERHGMSYTAQNLLATDTVETWSETGLGTQGGYVKSLFTQYTYSTTEKPTEIIVRAWMNKEGIYENSSRMIYTYFAFDSVETIINQRWTTDPQNVGKWLNMLRATYSYNNKNLLNTLERDLYDSSSAAWNHATFDTWTYDAHDCYATYKNQAWNSTDKKYINVKQIKWTNMQITIGVIQKFARGSTSSRELVKFDGSQLVLNKLPEQSRVSLVTVNGRSVANLVVDKARANKEVHVDNMLNRLPSGVYLLHVTANGKTQIQQIQIMR